MSLRPTWDNIYLDIAKIISRRSSCVKLQTAAVIVKYTENFKGSQIIATGYNGTFAGAMECSEFWKNMYIKSRSALSFAEWLRLDDIRAEHREWSAKNEMHAEANALRYISANDVKNCVMYSIYSPCNACAKDILAYGIKTVIYQKKYARGDDAIHLLRKAGVDIRCAEQIS